MAQAKYFIRNGTIGVYLRISLPPIWEKYVDAVIERTQVFRLLKINATFSPILELGAKPKYLRPLLPSQKNVDTVIERAQVLQP